MIALWDPLRPAPAVMYERACALLPSDPLIAEHMLRAAVDDSRGSFPEAQLQLCMLVIRSHDSDEIDRLCDALNWGEAQPETLMSLAYVANDAGHLEPARRAYLELRRREGPYAVTALEGLARLHLREQEPGRAYQCLEELTRIAPDDPRGWLGLAYLHEDRQNPAAAAAAYRQALPHIGYRREEISVRHRLVERLIDAGDVDRASEELEALAARVERPTARMQALRERIASLVATAPDREQFADDAAQ